MHHLSKNLPKPYVKSIASANFRKMRKRVGLSQEQLAEALHVTQVTISRWEQACGEPVIPCIAMHYLCSISGTDMDAACTVALTDECEVDVSYDGSDFVQNRLSELMLDLRKLLASSRAQKREHALNAIESIVGLCEEEEKT